MESMNSFFKKLSTLKSAVKRGEKVHGVYLYITPNFQLVAISDPYCKIGETREKARKRGKVEYEFIDLNCSCLKTPICLGSIDSVYKRIKEDFRLNRSIEQFAETVSYRFTESYQRELQTLSDRLEGGLIGQDEYFTLFAEMNERYRQEEERNKTVLPYSRDCFDIELVGNELQYCYNLELFDQLEMVYNPSKTLFGEDRKLSSTLIPGINLPSIPSPLLYKETKRKYELLKSKYSSYSLPSYWNFSADKDAEIETLIRERQERKEAREKANKSPKTSIQRAIEKEAREAEKARKGKTPKQSFKQDTRGAIELYSNSGKGVKIYHDMTDKKYLIFADTPEKYLPYLTSNRWSFRADLGGVFRYGARGERGREALKDAIAYFDRD